MGGAKTTNRRGQRLRIKAGGDDDDDVIDVRQSDH